jgi:hypothetical protein
MRNLSPLPFLIGIAVLLSRRKREAPEERARRKFTQLHAATGDERWDPEEHPLEQIIKEFKLVMGLPSTDGTFNADTESSLDQELLEHAIR